MAASHDDRKAREDNRNWFARHARRDEYQRRAEVLDALWRRRLSACVSTDICAPPRTGTGAMTEVDGMSVIRRELAEVIFASGILDDIATDADEGRLDDRDAMADAEAIAKIAHDHYQGAVKDRDALRAMLKRLLDVALVDGYGETVRDEAEALLNHVGGQSRD